MALTGAPARRFCHAQSQKQNESSKTAVTKDNKERYRANTENQLKKLLEVRDPIRLIGFLVTSP